MDTKQVDNPVDVKDRTTTERTSDRELVVTRTFNGPAHLVFKAWTTPELLMRWWAPESFGINLVGCEVDARTDGRYRFLFDVPGQPEPIALVAEVVGDAAEPGMRLRFLGLERQPALREKLRNLVGRYQPRS